MQTSLSSCPCTPSAPPLRQCRRGRHTSVRANAILATPPQRGPGSSEASTSQPAGGVFAWGANAASVLRLAWPGGQDTQSEAQQVQKAIQEASRQQASKAGRERPAPDVGRFLSSCSDHELRHVRMLASLTGLTYYMGSLTPRSLRRRHGLELVYTSLACELTAFEPSKTPEESLADGDGMAVSLADARSMYAARAAAEAQRLAGASNIVTFPSKSMGALAAAQPVSPRQQPQQKQPAQQSPPASPSKRATAAAAPAATAAPAPSNSSSPASSSASSAASGGWNPADLVAAKLSEAAALASAAALQPLASAAGSLYSSGVGFVSSALAQQLPVERLAAAAIAGGVAGAESANGPSNPSEVKAASTSSCPSEWFVADDATSHTRYFVIQGSDSLEHWKTNLMFDPVVFEDAAMGVMVHRGVYEAAQALYERFLPLVQEHAESSPFARVCFTGHSIGGSMATLLALLFKKRGVLRASQIAPCCTFGAPAVFCEGGACCSSCAEGAPAPAGSGRGPRALAPKPCSGGEGQAYRGVQVAGGGGLLAACGLQDDAIRNVIMHRDIVPRAFACDYTVVADILRSWGPGFKEHRCLARDGRKHMYFFVGQMMVLQPDADLAFTNGEPYHPMLPDAGGLYVLSEPTLASTMAAMRDARRAGSSSMAAAVSNAATSGNAAVGGGAGASTKQVASVSEVVWELMDNPHPLDILGDPGAYLATGSISRYHNPDNYKRALGCLLAKRREEAAGQLRAPSAVPGIARKQRAFFPVVSAANAGPARGALGAGVAAVPDVLQAA